MLKLVSAAVAAEGGVTYGTAGVITPLTTMAATLVSKYGYTAAFATNMVARAFGIPIGTDIAGVDPIAAIAASGRKDKGATVGWCRLTLLNPR
jgi:hypothetical protein